jgi:PBSX family phage portal protein
MFILEDFFMENVTAPRAKRKVLFKSYSPLQKLDEVGLENVSSNRAEVDPFEPVYQQENLIQPPYRYPNLYSIAEESDIISACVAAYQKNIDGFGYRLDFLGDDRTELHTKEAQEQYETAINFFDESNANQSFQMLREPFRKDFEFLGQGYFEVVRFRTGGIAAMYYTPAIDIRMAVVDPEPVTIVTSLYRGGRWRKVNIKKRFRRFAQISYESSAIRWFKELGDPRVLCAVSGRYVGSRKEAKEVASELFMIQQPSGGRTYSLPRWISCVTDAVGRANSQYVNYNLIETQGIPPMLIVIENGTLTDESKDELRVWAESMRGAENFSRIALLETQGNMLGLDDKSNVKLELKNLSEYRSSDLMFDGYLKSTGDTIRQAFRLPKMYLGELDSASYASSYTIVKISESQVFNPERQVFDEHINKQILWKELGCKLWKYTSLGPQIASTEELRLSMKELIAGNGLTTNNILEIANQLFNLRLSKYDEPWADLPVALVRNQSNNGTFQLKEITNSDPKAGSQVKQPSSEDQGGKPVTSGSPSVPPIPNVQVASNKKASTVKM